MIQMTRPQNIISMGLSENGRRVSIDNGYGLATYKSALKLAERQSELKNIVGMDNHIISDAQFEEIMLNADVKNVECFGFKLIASWVYVVWRRVFWWGMH